MKKVNYLIKFEQKKKILNIRLVNYCKLIFVIIIFYLIILKKRRKSQLRIL